MMLRSHEIIVVTIPFKLIMINYAYKKKINGELATLFF
jgi:hypothetical protein